MLDVRRRLETVFGFKKSKLWVHNSIIAIVLIAMLGTTYLSFLGRAMPYSTILAITAGFGLILFLCIDSFLFWRDLLYSSPREVLPFVRKIDSHISRAIGDAEKYVRSFEADNDDVTLEIESQAREISADFEARPPYPQITGRWFKRAISNFLLTIFCFSIVTLSLESWDKYCGTTPTYGHDCSKFNTPLSAVLHSFYYHAVVFQSLGDAEHSPRTPLAQGIATLETFISFFYLIGILGGILSTASIVRDNLTPKIFRESLVLYLTVLCAHKHPMRKEDFDEVKKPVS